MMTKQMLLATFCSALLIAGCNQAADTSATVPAPETAATDQAKPAMDENTLLSVNGQPVSKAMYALYFQDRMRGVPEAQNSPQLQMSVLNELANVIIAAQDAEKKGIDKRPEVVATLDLLRAKLLTQAVVQEFAEEHKPTEEQIKTYYEAEYANQSNKEYKARHILVKEEAEAKSLIEELDKGGDFAELAKQHSTGPTGKNGGDLGWFDANQMVKPFADAVAGMEKGSYSKEPIQTQFGWHVILLEDTRDSDVASLDSVRADITSKLQQQALTDYMQNLRKESEIVFNESLAAKKPAAEETAPTDEAQPAAESQSAEAQPATEEQAAPAPAEETAKPASE